ncbi:unnamed protein product [Macrosiphum euphorbiae]|uniref:DDE Tnp4 domain-containing protein n=1 Tax=Macrosiphum euphorbiae TaxID=13131 RepID=A0AAV0WG64_9HEMI|nr:unnamed protein product [Macrosiphum euphorbiae]
MAKKFRIYSRPLEINVDTINTVIMTTFILHNFLRTRQSGDEEYFDNLEEEYNQQDQNMLLPFINDSRRGSNEAFEIRKKFINWFIENRLEK